MGLVWKLKALFSLTLRPSETQAIFSLYTLLWVKGVLFYTGVQFRELINGNINLERTGDVLAVDYLKIPIKVRLI